MGGAGSHGDSADGCGHTFPSLCFFLKEIDLSEGQINNPSLEM